MWDYFNKMQTERNRRGTQVTLWLPPHKSLSHCDNGWTWDVILEWEGHSYEVLGTLKVKLWITKSRQRNPTRCAEVIPQGEDNS